MFSPCCQPSCCSCCCCCCWVCTTTYLALSVLDVSMMAGSTVIQFKHVHEPLGRNTHFGEENVLQTTIIIYMRTHIIIGWLSECAYRLGRSTIVKCTLVRTAGRHSNLRQNCEYALCLPLASLLSFPATCSRLLMTRQQLRMQTSLSLGACKTEKMHYAVNEHVAWEQVIISTDLVVVDFVQFLYGKL